jgi:hypothetical protein
MNAKIPPLPATARKPTALRGFALAAGIPLFIIGAFYVVRELELDGITLTATVGLILGAVSIASVLLRRRHSSSYSNENSGHSEQTAGDLTDQEQSGRSAKLRGNDYAHLYEPFDEMDYQSRQFIGNMWHNCCDD